MVDYKELYSSIQNPLDEPETMKKLLKAYADSSKGLSGFYGKLTKTVEKQYTRGQYYTKDADYFYAMMFNKWKNSILNMSKERFIELRQQGSFGNDLVTLRNYLKGIPDVKTKKEADSIFYGNYENKTLAGAMEKYKWTAFGEESGWVHVCSRYVTAKSDKVPKVAHRLYLNTESIDTYKMISRFVEKCDEHKLPYYFKFDQYADRDDTIVIYSDMENLINYVQILNEINQQYPDLVARAKEPPALTGKIDNWIGYGSEPAKTADGHNQSFNSVRAKILETAIDRENKKWIMAHRNQTIKHKGKLMPFQDYVAIKATEKFLQELESKVSRTYFKNETLEDVAKRYGYSVSDVKSPQFRQRIYSVISNSMDTKLPEICGGTKASNMKSIVMNVRDGKQISFDGYTLNETIQEMSMEIAKHDPNFLSNIKTAILRDAKAYGIDTDKFCFDVSTRDAMFKQKQVQLPNSPTKHSVDYQAQPIREEDRTISGSALRTSLEKSRTTYSDMERETKEMAERQERKRLLFLQKSGANMTNEQINRLHTLNTLYQTTPENNIPIR